MRVIPLAVYGVWHCGTLNLSEMILGIASVFPSPAARIGIDLRTSKNAKLAPIHAFLLTYNKLPKLRTWVRFPSPAP